MRVVVFSYKTFELTFLHTQGDLFKSSGITFDFLHPRLDANTAPLAHGADAVCVFVNDILDAAVLEILAKGGTRCVLLRCAGFDRVDRVAAEKHNVIVLRVPSYSPHAVSEFAVALLQTVNRKTHKAYNRTREGNFCLNGLMGADLHEKVVAVIGTGKIGRLFAKAMKGFGCRVIGYDIYKSDEAIAMGVEYMTLDKLLATADVISLHCPLFPSTRHIISAESIAKMKRGVILINTSRGELIRTDDLIQGLKKGTIGACGIDVYEGEGDLFFDDHSGEILEDDRITILLSFPNVVVTPHLAFCTETAMENIWHCTVENMLEYVAYRDDSTKTLTNRVPLPKE